MKAADLQGAIQRSAEFATKPFSDGSLPSFNGQLIAFVGHLEGMLREVDPKSAEYVALVGRARIKTSA